MAAQPNKVNGQESQAQKEDSKPEGTPKKEKTKRVLATIIDEHGDIVKGLIEVPESDKRPAHGGPVRQDPHAVRDGNPLKDRDGEV